jgi:Domain of Unknown Function (DUF1080)
LNRVTPFLAVAFVFAPTARSDDGFKPLFNGKDLTGWKQFMPDKNVKPEDVWSVTGGVITCAGAKKPNGYIITEKEYGNYVLKVQWRFPAGSPGGNSGVLLHVQQPDKVWPKSVEAQLQSGEAGDFWLIDAKLDIDKERNNPRNPRNYIRIGEKWVYPEGSKTPKAERKNVEKPIGEWNQYEIHCDGGNIKLMVNGQLVNEGKNGELTRGRILLQAEGADIQFRNIEIKTK